MGPLPRYMARLDAAEAVCEWLTVAFAPPEKTVGHKLLAAWRKAKEASER
jgi:hypothetical protein